MVLADLHVAAVAMIGKLTDELRVERAKEREALRAAVIDHLDPGNNYWQHRHKAEQKLLAACALLQILEAA